MTIQRMRVDNRSVSHYAWSTTRKTQMSIAYTVAGDDYEGGLAYARSQDDSAGVNSKSPETYWNGYSRVQFKFRKQALYCDNTPGNYGTPVDTGKRRWLPYNFTGFNKMVFDSATWTCNTDHAGPIYSTTWVSKEVRNRWNGFFSIAGIKLDAVQENSTAHKAQYSIRSAYSKARLCGRYGDLVDASTVQELHIG